MLIDLHTHESTYSGDSFQNLDEITKKAGQLGLDAVCITDHDTQALAGDIGWSSRLNGVRVFVGCEVFTFQGDILVFGVPNLPVERISIKTLHEIVSVQGGVMIAAHPYRHNNRGLKDGLFHYRKYLHAVEAFNGSTFPEDNDRAVQAAKKLNLPMTGAGDSHHTEAIGRFATFFTDRIKEVKDLVRAIHEGNCAPAIPTSSGYETLIPNHKTKVVV